MMAISLRLSYCRKSIDRSRDDQSDQTSEGINKTLTAVIATAAFKSNKQSTCKVVGIIVRKRRQCCGVLQPSLLANATRHIVIPADLTIDSWSRTFRYPHRHFVRSLRPLGDVDTENEVILLEHDVPHSKLSEEVLNCLPKMPWIITTEAVYLVPQHIDSITQQSSLLMVPGVFSTLSKPKSSKPNSNLSDNISNYLLNQLTTDFEIGHFLRARATRQAVLYYTADVIDDEDEDDDSYDGEEEEDDEESVDEKEHKEALTQ
uniref:CSD2 domain-containing protein n=1 Tax=Glossina morsitans morsitans TaxID=37546 RepID=A0A1B0GBW7_GLOMM